MKQIPIIYENEEILIINKPAGIAVQGGKDIAHPLDKELAIQVGYPIYLVHRLDRDTAGLMIVAKSPLYAAQWTKIIGGRLVQKEYTAITIGSLKNKSGTFRTKIVQHGTEKPAITHYNIIEENRNKNIVLDAPLLFEAGLDKVCTDILCVLSDKEKRIERIVNRDNVSPEVAGARINSQPEDSFYLSRCSYAVFNNGDVSSLMEQLDNIFGGQNED